ncbi:PREDICTED: probable protein phosphatase 2C 27 [Lupinus angustifolius]|uniref:probable protein phosphatase 2C 27 n=1 Tax=Lupinus angustifolius TaxID=3871 RepID=UPI00092FCCDC|nr:PREDICTED: probable protein phosphatase 2C 27 [Lupinus angustifolius]XP_019441092.1 PREDICTED: probable protein phosphatase 2C 27 [Lupinus angustifolius]
MCAKEKGEQVAQNTENIGDRRVSWPLHCDILHAHMDNLEKDSTFTTSIANSLPLESICENSEIADKKQNLMSFVPVLRSGEWSDIGGRPYMEDTHISIGDLAKKFGYNMLCEETVSLYGVFDGHGGKSAAQFVRDHLPRLIVEDADFPFELKKVVTRSFLETDAEFAKTCSIESCLSSGTTALTAIIFGRSLLVANAGDCRAVLCHSGKAIEMSKDHRPFCIKERKRIESLGGFVDDGYLNGLLGVTRALGNWHLEGMKENSGRGGPLIAEPEIKMATLTKEDELLIIGSDGIWDVFRSQNAVDFARRRLQEHNDVKQCCKEIVEEAIKRGGTDNLTVVIVCFHPDPPPPVVVERPRVRRSISAEGLQNLKCLLEG